jgi:hypothetical protein
MMNQNQFNPTPRSIQPPPVGPSDVDVDVATLRAMPKDERKALARIAKALLAAEDEETKAELAAELRKRCERAQRADASVSTPTYATMAAVGAPVSGVQPQPPRFGTGDWAERPSTSYAVVEEDDACAAKRAKPTSLRGRLDFSGRVSPGIIDESPSARVDRAERFAREAVAFTAEIAKRKGRGAPTMQEMKRLDAGAVGTNTSLEKTYLRLTEAPSMATVRPPHVLDKALGLVKSKWVANKNYEYAKDQLKSIRQDLTVQHISDGDLVRETYQTHARIALECGDLAEYNQCQAVLKALHAASLERILANAKSKSSSSKKKATEKRKRSFSERKRDSHEETLEGSDDHAEFTAYRLIYAAGAGNKNERSAALLRELRDVPKALKSHPFVRHALQVCEARASSNFHRFFVLRRDAPRMASHLMDIMVPDVRDRAIRAMLRAYAPTIPIDFIASTLGFPDADACETDLIQTYACVVDDAHRVDVKASNAARTKRDIDGADAGKDSRTSASVLDRLRR